MLLLFLPQSNMKKSILRSWNNCYKAWKTSSSGFIVGLVDDNENDCYGIFSPVQK